jgi:hypothetical protein
MGAVMHLTPVAPLPDEMRPPEHLQVLRDRGLRDGKTLRERGRRALRRFDDPLEQDPPRRIGEGFHHGGDAVGAAHANI